MGLTVWRWGRGQLIRFAFLLLSCGAIEVLTYAATGEPQLASLSIGDHAPDFQLPGIDGRVHSLQDYREAPILMIAFISNHCPDSNATAPRLVAFANEMRTRGVAIVGINPNHPEG
ncbi:MAG TPA: redoxin domain-containing protein, partial [Opitutaceae bacterium]|nr:redoxin domain-containing protein [Opitutaceae bacterium]